jgi:hypothetical protein
MYVLTHSLILVNITFSPFLLDKSDFDRYNWLCTLCSELKPFLCHAECTHTVPPTLYPYLGFNVALGRLLIIQRRTQYRQSQSTGSSKNYSHYCFNIVTYYGWFLLCFNEKMLIHAQVCGCSVYILKALF